MGTPNFANTARPTISGADRLASHGQITRAIMPMLADRDWQNAGLSPRWVSRIAVINATLFIASEAATDDRIVEQLDIALFDRHDVTGTFHQLMSYSYDAAVNDERDPSMSKPLTVAGASALIDLLGKLEFKGSRSHVEEANVAAAKAANTPAAPAEVPAGRYAIDTEDGAINETAFYKVDHGKGRWAGRVFVSRMVGGHDDIAVKDPKARATILAKIAADPEAASLRFGREIGVCGRCGITLTNDESRARGIGPECAKKGW